MSDFSEIENDLRKLRPAQASPILFQRIEEALVGDRTANASLVRQSERLRHNWNTWGFGLAAAAVLVLFAAVSIERSHDFVAKVATGQHLSEPKLAPKTLQPSASSEQFVPAGATRVVYNTRDEGLHFTNGSHQPLRRVRYEARQTWRWRNPTTGASLRVSYPSEEVLLIPVSGQ